MTSIFFNLLVNAAFSMACGLLVVGFCIWFFRVEDGPWKLFILSLPFVKIIYDSLRGVPADSVLLSGIDPFSLPPKHQLLQIGGGFTYWGPKLNLIFSVQDTSGREYASSIGDYLVIWLNRTYGTHIPFAILTAVAAVSAGLIFRRILAAIRFEKTRSEDRATACIMRKVKFRFRTVDIYRSSFFTGTPFTGGVLKPYICIPENAYERLNSQELDAVIAHELAHVRQYDLVTSFSVQLLGDLFWFVPGYRWLSRRIDRLRELVADCQAVRLGIDPSFLACALLKLRDLESDANSFKLYSALFRDRPLLKVRIEKLLGARKEKPPRFGWANFWFRSVISVWIVTAVMIATLGGNHETLGLENPQWFNRLLKRLNLEVLNIENREQ